MSSNYEQNRQIQISFSVEVDKRQKVENQLLDLSTQFQGRVEFNINKAVMTVPETDKVQTIDSLDIAARISRQLNVTDVIVEDSTGCFVVSPSEVQGDVIIPEGGLQGNAFSAKVCPNALFKKKKPELNL